MSTLGEAGYSVHTCKAKTTRNPLYRWSVGQGAINEFAFSPCSHFLAVVSQDGYLRIFNYDTMDIVGRGTKLLFIRRPNRMKL